MSKASQLISPARSLVKPTIVFSVVTATKVNKMAGLPREVIKWLQSLDLSHPIRYVRRFYNILGFSPRVIILLTCRDFANGCLVAEILSWYYPQDVQLHSISNGTSVQTRLANWQLIDKVSLGLALSKPFR